MKTIETKSQEYAEKIFSAIANKYQSTPWPEFRQALADIYLAGATEALSSQWRDPKDGLPKLRENVIIRYRTRYQGRWLILTIIDSRSEYDDPFKDKDKDVIAWMPIPQLPDNLSKYEK